MINSKIAVTNIDQQNNGILCINIPSVLIFKAVEIKLIAPNKEDTPAKCKENMAKSTEPPECDCIADNGGYTVHPVKYYINISSNHCMLRSVTKMNKFRD